MTKAQVVAQLLPSTYAPKETGASFAPTNIALCKYWGKRNTELNLPATSSLSIALPGKGAFTKVMLSTQAEDTVTLNGLSIATNTSFYRRLTQFIELFRKKVMWRLHIEIQMTIPVAAGLASSACGFAALTMALNDLFQWQLPLRDLSILARLGSGSAARSLWSGFVEWHQGEREDGMDCYAEPLSMQWPSLCVGILTISQKEKFLSSREAMLRTVKTSDLYRCWPDKVQRDLTQLKRAIHEGDFTTFGMTAESNALAMHATMLSSWPPICYALPETLAAMQQLWELRQQGIEVYFTQDAGPNLKFLFLEESKPLINKQFSNLDIIYPFKQRVG